ncbi:anti-sigma factor domain-containing protein [Erythrobacter sp. AP23]|uniref:anti-sigma factor n=1 Tax=Erythrobacter sp. AP23 TaxID=499656 RepID=UPI00076CAAB8|nr:anti-sigma factor [Erythrobacter sp. AP23]KWV92562.1 hypothetical protein ASS64_15050 [Erythrobacter sp. AP23]
MTSDETLAAEYALGLLEGEDLLAARAREVRDPAFAEEVARWQERLAPLADAIHPRMPREEVWQRIEAELASDDGSADVVSLRRSLRRWQWAGGLSAAAAVALAFLALPQLTGPGEPAPDIATAPGSDAPLLAANMPIEGTPLSLDFTYLPEKDSLLVGAVGLTADGVHDHEIWFVPEEGDLVSLGIVTPGKVVAHTVPEDVARALENGSQLVLTREPLGGKPEGVDAGPVVAEARFTTI